MGHTDIAARVALLRELASQEVVELGLEDTVGNELSLFADLARHFGDAGGSKMPNEHYGHDSVIQYGRVASSPQTTAGRRETASTRTECRQAWIQTLRA